MIQEFIKKQVNNNHEIMEKNGNRTIVGIYCLTYNHMKYIGSPVNLCANP